MYKCTRRVKKKSHFLRQSYPPNPGHQAMPKHTVQYALTDAVDAIRSDVEKVVLLDR